MPGEKGNARPFVGSRARQTHDSMRQDDNLGVGKDNSRSLHSAPLRLRSGFAPVEMTELGVLLANQHGQTWEEELAGGVIYHVDLAGVEAGFELGERDV